MNTAAAAAPAHEPGAPSFAATLATMRSVLERRFGLDVKQLTESSELESLGLDSLSFVEYTFDIESELGIVLPDVPRDLRTVGELARFINAEVERQKGQSPQ